jgi:hypothetical protein
VVTVAAVAYGVSEQFGPIQLFLNCIEGEMAIEKKDKPVPLATKWLIFVWLVWGPLIIASDMFGMMLMIG